VIQTIAAYAIVAAAAGWLVWRMLLPATVRGRLKARLGGKDCGDDCGCSS
jgi:hypothetical protein